MIVRPKHNAEPCQWTLILAEWKPRKLLALGHKNTPNCVVPVCFYGLEGMPFFFQFSQSLCEDKKEQTVVVHVTVDCAPALFMRTRPNSRVQEGTHSPSPILDPTW